MANILENIKEGFIEAIVEFKDFFISLYDTIFNFFAKMFGEQYALITMLGLGFLILMVILSKVISR